MGKYDSWRLAAEGKIASKGITCTLLYDSKSGTAPDANGEVTSTIVSVSFPAVIRAFSSKDWAYSKVDDFYAVMENDFYLLAGAESFEIAGHRPSAGDVVTVPTGMAGATNDYIIVKANTFAPDGEPIYWPMIHLRPRS
jgi:hypothetical protein